MSEWEEILWGFVLLVCVMLVPLMWAVHKDIKHTQYMLERSCNEQK